MIPKSRLARFVGAIGLVGLAGAASVVGRAALWRPLPLAGPPSADGFVRVAGVLHVHTTMSDGGGTPDEVIAEASRAGLRFVGVTDHGNANAKPWEGYHDGLLVLVGTEISTTAGHLMALGIRPPTFRFSGDALDALDDVHELGGVAFAAHPTSPRADLTWTGWDLPGPWGLEVQNGDSEWRAAGPWLLWTGLAYLGNPRYALLGTVSPNDKSLARWDRVLALRRAAGIHAADAHSRLPITRHRALRFPSYGSLFAVAQTHVLLERPLTGDGKQDVASLVAALRQGRAYAALDGLADAKDVSFTLEADGHVYAMGDDVPIGSGGRLRVRGPMPANAVVRLLRHGQPLAEGRAPLEVDLPGPGVYRAEIRVPGWSTPWVLTNPIYAFPQGELEQRTKRGDWPTAPPAPAPVSRIDDFEGATSFAAEFDTSSSMETPPFDSRGGVGGTRAARLAFRLGEPGPGRPYTWCALVSRQGRDLSGLHGLEVSVRADGVYRIWVQVRDENKASTDEGTEWWFGSIRTSTAWQRVSVSFDRLRSLNPHSDGRLDLDKVRQLVFVLDHGAVAPGATGTIWLDDLAAY